MAVSISGGLDVRYQLINYRSMRLWQPILTKTFKQKVVNKFRNKYEKRFSIKEVNRSLRASYLSLVDKYAIVKYNGFQSVQHYYHECSAMGGNDLPNNEVTGGIQNLAIPHLVIYALDDPIVHWRTLGTYNPTELVKSGSGFLMMLLTQRGGHVGWPLGMNPKINGWKWMSDAVKDFVEGVSDDSIP